jgi:hypothetical protein
MRRANYEKNIDYWSFAPGVEHSIRGMQHAGADSGGN